MSQLKWDNDYEDRMISVNYGHIIFIQCAHVSIEMSEHVPTRFKHGFENYCLIQLDTQEPYYIHASNCLPLFFGESFVKRLSLGHNKWIYMS